MIFVWPVLAPTADIGLRVLSFLLPHPSNRQNAVVAKKSMTGLMEMVTSRADVTGSNYV